MVDAPKPKILQRAVLASGLVTTDQLESALRAASVASGSRHVVPNQIDDEQLGQALVELEILNSWQLEQLRAGRTKFTLGPYQIIDSIGRGGMGHVFKGQHSMLGRVEAVKVLPKAKNSPEAIAAFQREIRAQAQLDHPNLVRVSYAGQDGDTYFFVNEFVPGTDLRRLLRANGPLTMEQAATIISQAAEALDYAHARGIVHRDIKPGNLLVMPSGRTKVTDLGLAGYFHGDEAVDDPRSGKIVGTADYLAPEAIRSPTEIRPESDIYALGCTLYYAVTGKVPFPGGRTADKLRRHCEEPPITPRRINPQLSDAFLEVVADMMEKRVDRRISSAREVVTRLAAWTTSGVTAAAYPSEDEGGIRTPVLGAYGSSDNPGADSQVTPFVFDDVPPSSSGSGSQSQISQSTSPISASTQETAPIGHEGQLEHQDETQPRPKRSAILILAIVVIVVLSALGVWLLQS